MTFNPVQGFQTVSAVPLPRRTIKPLQSLQPMSFGDRKYQIDDPTKLNSMADVLFNKRARQRAFAIATGGETLGDDPISWIAGSVVAGIKHIENTFIDPIASGDMMQLVGNSWNAAMEDLDVVSNPFKGMVIEPGNSSDSLVLGALAAVAAAGLMYATGGTFGIILQSGLLAGGATAVGNAVLTDPEAAARGFVKGLGSTDIGRYRYDYDTGNVLLNLFGEIVTDPLNMMSFGTGTIRESAQLAARTADDVALPFAARIGRDFVEAPLRTHQMLKLFGDLDRKVTMAALMMNPIGASLGAIGIGKKIFRNTVMSKNVLSIVEAATKPGVKSFLGLDEVVEVSRGTVLDLISKARNEFLLELGVLGAARNEQYLDAVNAMAQHVANKMGGTLESNMETLSLFMQDLIYSAPGDYSFAMKYGNGELGFELLKIWDAKTMTVFNEFDSVLGTTVSKTSHVLPGFAHDYMKNGYVVGTSAVDAYFKGVMEHVATWGAVRNGLLLEFGNLDAQIKTLLKVDDANQVPLGEYLSAFFKAMGDRFPEFITYDPNKLVGHKLFEMVYERYISNTGLTFEEFLDYHRMYAAGESLLRTDYAQNVANPDGVKYLPLDLSGEEEPLVSVALDSLPVNYMEEVHPHSGEPILDQAQQSVADLVAEDADPEVVVNAFRSVLGDEVVDEIVGPYTPTKGTTKKLLAHMLNTKFDTVRLFDKMLEVMPRILHPQITSAYMIAQNDPEVKEITGFLMDMSKMPRKQIIDWANAAFPAGTPNELKARIVNLIYDYSVVRAMAENPDILRKPDMFVPGAVLPEEFDAAANPQQQRRLNNLAKSKTGILRGSLLAYDRFRGNNIASLTEDFRKIGQENHFLLGALRNLDLINVSLYIREYAKFELWRSGYHVASTNKSYNSAVMAQNQMRPEVADMVSTLMDENTPLGKLFNLMVFMQTGSDVEFNVFHNAQTLYTAIMGGSSYFKFMQNLNQIRSIKAPVPSNQSLVLSMEQPVIVETSKSSDGLETVKLTPLAKNKKTWKLSQIYRTASFNAALKDKKGGVQIVDMSKLNILDAATSEILLRRVKALDEMIDTVKASINVDVAVFEDEVRELYDVVQGLSAEIDGIRQAIRDLDSKQSGALRTIYNALDNITVGRDKMNQIIDERRAFLDDKLGTIVSEIEDIDDAITELHVEADDLFRKEMSSWVQKYINNDYYSPLKKLYARMADQMANDNEPELDDILQKMQNASPMAEEIINTVGEQIGEPFSNTFMPLPFVKDFAFQSSVGTKTRNDDAVKEFNKGIKNAKDPGANVSDTASKYRVKGIRKPNLIFKYNNRPTHRRFGYGFTFPSISSGDIMTLGVTGFFKSFGGNNGTLPVDTYVRWYLQKVAEHTRNGIDPISADYRALGDMLKHFMSSFWKQDTATFPAIFLYYKLTRLNPDLAEDFLSQIETLNSKIHDDKNVDRASVDAELYSAGEAAMYKFLEESAKQSPNSVFARVHITIMTNSDTVERQMVSESRNMVFRALLKSGDIHKLYQYSEADLIEMFGDEYAYEYYIRVIRELYAVLFRHVYPAEGIDSGKTIYWDQSALRAFIYTHPELDAGDIYDLVYRTIDPDYDTLLIINHEYRRGIGFDNSLLESKTNDLFILPSTDPKHPFARVRKLIYTPRAKQEWSTQEQLFQALSEDEDLIQGKTRHPDGIYTEGTSSEIQKVVVYGEQLTQKVDPLTDPSRSYRTQIINVKADESDYKGMKQPQLFEGEAPRTWATDLGYKQQKLLMDFRAAMKEVFSRRQAYLKYGFSARDLFSSSFYVAHAVRRTTNKLTKSSHVAAPFGQPASATSDALIVPVPGYPLNVVADPTLRSVDISNPLTKEQEHEKLAQTILDDATRIYKHNLEVYGTFTAKYGSFLSRLRGPQGILAYKPGTKVVFDGHHGTIVSPEDSTVLKQKFDEAHESYEQDVKDLEELQWLEDNQVVEYKGKTFEYPLDIYADAAGGYGDSASDGISSPRQLETPEEAMEDKLEVDEYFVSISGNDFALKEHRRASEYINVLKSTNVINEKYELLDPDNDEGIMALHSDFLYDFSSGKVHESIRYTPISDTREAVIRQLEKLGKVSEGFERAVTSLTLQNIDRVNRIVRQYKNRGVPVADLKNRAQMAMYESMAKYDPKKGTLAKYLDSVIRHAVLRELREVGYHMGSDTETTDRLQRFNRIASRLGTGSRDFYTVKQGLEERISKYESSKQTFAEFKAANLKATATREAYLSGPSDEERAFETAKETVLANMRYTIRERVKRIGVIYDRLGQVYNNLATLEADETLERYLLESRDILKDKMAEFKNSKLSLQSVQDILGMTTIDPDEARGWYMDLAKAKRAVDDETTKLETENWRSKTDVDTFTRDIRNYQEEYDALSAYIKTATGVNERSMKNAVERYQWLGREIQILNAKVHAIQTYMKSDARLQALNMAQSAYDEVMKSFRKYASKNLLPEYKPGAVTYGFVDPALDKTRKNLVAEIERLTAELEKESSVTKAVVDPVNNGMLSNQYKMTIDLTGTSELGANVKSLIQRERRRLIKEFERLKPARKSGLTPSGFEYKPEDKVIVRLDKPRTDILSATHMAKAGKNSVVIKAWGKETEIEVGDYFRIPYSAVGNRKLHGTWGKVLAIIDHPYDSPKFAHGIYQVEFEYVDREFNPETKMFSMTPKLDYEVLRKTDWVYPAEYGSILRMERALLEELNRYQGKANIETIVGLIKQARRDVIGIRNDVIKYYTMDMKKGVLSFPATPLEVMQGSPTKVQELTPVAKQAIDTPLDSTSAIEAVEMLTEEAVHASKVGVKLPTVFNLHTSKDLMAHPGYVYIGRSGKGIKSSLGNPYSVKEYGREKAIDMFEKDLVSAIAAKNGPMYDEFMRLVDLVRKGEELHLGCFCAPQPCHGEVIIHWINNILAAETEAEIAVVKEGSNALTDLERAFVWDEDGKQVIGYSRSGSLPHDFNGFMDHNGVAYNYGYHDQTAERILKVIDPTWMEDGKFKDVQASSEWIYDVGYGFAADDIRSYNMPDAVYLSTRHNYLVMVEGVPAAIPRTITGGQLSRLKDVYEDRLKATRTTESIYVYTNGDSPESFEYGADTPYNTGEKVVQHIQELLAKYKPVDVSEAGGIRYFEGHITSLKGNQVFVFGSNLDGEHGKNAAAQAKEQFGAIEGQGSGMMGSSYAFPTKKTARGRALPDAELQKNMDTFIAYAKAHPEKEFLLTDVGTGLAKVDPLKIARMLSFSTKGMIPPNVVISKKMADIFEASKKATPAKKNMEMLKLRQDVKDILAPNAIHNFTYTNRDYHFLSNMYPVQFTYKGKVYKSVEHAYQSIRFTDPDIADMIAGTSSGFEAKSMANKLLKEGETSEISFFYQRNMNIMRDLLRAKFNDNPGLKQSLLDTNDLPLVEGNVWGDDFWGVSSPSGENWLGRMLMELRGEYGGVGYVEWRKPFDPAQVYEYTPRTYPTLNGFLPEYLNENDPITLIGSRRLADATADFDVNDPNIVDHELTLTYAEHIERLKNIQGLLNEIGTVSRSGGAGGTDEIVTKYALVGKREIYTPWYGFVKSDEGKLYHGANIKDEMPLDRLGNQARAYQIAKEFYPGDLSTAKEAVRKLMTRNTYQILGPDLNSPSNFVIAWTPTGQDTGGTAQALRIARAMGIPVFNVYNDDDYNAIVQYLQAMLVRKKTGYKYTPAKGDYITGPTRVKPGYRFETKGEYGNRVLGDIIEPEDAK